MSSTIQFSPASPAATIAPSAGRKTEPDSTAETDSDGRNALHRAAAEGKTEVVRLLAENRDLREARDSKNHYTPLLVAAFYGHCEAVKILLRARADVTATGEHGYTALHLTAGQGQAAVVRVLAEHSDLREARDVNNQTPLHLAVSFGHLETCEILLRAGADPKAMDKDGDNALHCAVREGDTEIVRLFAKNRSLHRERNVSGNTPLLMAVIRGYRAACKILLKAGADPKVTNKLGRNALHCAAEKGRTEVIRLFAQNRNLLEERDHENLTPLLLAAAFDSRKACELLLKAKANPKATDSHGRNALHCAAAQGRTEIVRLFAKNSALLEARDTENESTPLMLAAYFGQREACEILLRARADPKARRKDGLTALESAGQQKHTAVVKLLSEPLPTSLPVVEELRLMREHIQLLTDRQAVLEARLGISLPSQERKEEKKESFT